MERLLNASVCEIVNDNARFLIIYNDIITIFISILGVVVIMMDDDGHNDHHQNDRCIMFFNHNCSIWLQHESFFY